MKTVLISIKPYWLFLIIVKTMGWKTDKEKTVEVRKSYPKNKDWNKTVILYCTKDKTSFNQIPKEYQPMMENLLGKVIGEFVCDKIIDIDYGIEEGVFFDGKHQRGFETNGIGNNPTCLSFIDLENYLTNNEGYGWHISDLVIYDKPRELSQFQKCTVKTTLKDGFIYRTPEKELFTMKRPPQSWCYVEKLEG